MMTTMMISKILTRLSTVERPEQWIKKLSIIVIIMLHYCMPCGRTDVQMDREAMFGCRARHASGDSLEKTV